MPKKLNDMPIPGDQEGNFLVKIFFEQGETRAYRYKDDKIAYAFAAGCFAQDTVVRVCIFKNKRGLPVLVKEWK